MKVYLIGSLRNPEIPAIAARLRREGYDTFDDWFAAGPEADDHWKTYEQGKGNSYTEALKGKAARHVFQFDHDNLDVCEIAILALPAGRSGHLELGWALGRGKQGYVLLDDPERWDVMYQFASGVFTTVDELVAGIPRPTSTPYLFVTGVDIAGVGPVANLPTQQEEKWLLPQLRPLPGRFVSNPV